jgi:putative transferase (TIGR04331 family)
MKSKIDWGIDVLKLIIKLLPEEIQNIDVKKPPRNFRSGKLINYSYSLYFNSKSRLDAAFAYLFNEKVIATQHGGHTYGSAMSSEYNKNIEFSTDYFISWGWIDYKNKPFKNILALPSPLLSKHLNKHSKKTETVFFTGTTMNMFLDVFGSWLTENEILKYRKNKAVFIAEYQKKILFRSFSLSPVFKY